jgi:riboflavin kinase/FMN adenylyltransferase
VAKSFDLEGAVKAHVFDGAKVCIGVFDGLHLGHRTLIDSLGEDGHVGSRVIVTFDIDPDEVFGCAGFKKLMSNDARIAALLQTDVDAVVVLPFEEVRNMEPIAFLDVLFAGYDPVEVAVGEGFRFGAKAAGNVQVMRDWAASRTSGCTVSEIALAELDGAPVSSTRIRGLLAAGCVDQAARLLGRPWRISGEVVRGRNQGADMGFATANLSIAPVMAVASPGVYGGYAYVDGKRYKAAISFGASPTFADQKPADMEVHVLDFAGDLYGRTLDVDFVEWIREMRKFDSLEELIATVTANIEYIRENL